MASQSQYCLWLRTKTAYYRDDSGARKFNPDSTTACYSCLKTQRPVGPDGEPADLAQCGASRGCFEEEHTP